MIEMNVFKMPEVVPSPELQSWKEKNKLGRTASTCPPEVEEFIIALDSKLGDFAQYGKDHATISGRDLHLCGIKEWEGEQVFSFSHYPIEIPKMQAVDHYTAMHRIFKRKGKKGLIDFCKARVKGTPLQRLLDALEVHVFHNERPEFIAIMSQIEQSKKLESVIA